MCQEAWRIILRRNLLQGVAGTWFLTRQIGDGQLYGCNVTNAVQQKAELSEKAVNVRMTLLLRDSC